MKVLASLYSFLDTILPQVEGRSLGNLIKALTLVFASLGEAWATDLFEAFGWSREFDI